MVILHSSKISYFWRQYQEKPMFSPAKHYWSRFWRYFGEFSCPLAGIGQQKIIKNTLFDQKLCYSRLHVKLKIHLAIEQDFMGRGIFNQNISKIVKTTIIFTLNIDKAWKTVRELNSFQYWCQWKETGDMSN